MDSLSAYIYMYTENFVKMKKKKKEKVFNSVSTIESSLLSSCMLLSTSLQLTLTTCLDFHKLFFVFLLVADENIN